MNEFLIEQTPEEFKATAAFQAKAELMQIVLQRFCANRAEEEPAIEQGIALSLTHKPEKAVVVGDSAVFRIEFVFDASAYGVTEKPFFHIDCCYELKYQLRPGYSPAEEELSAFHAGNAVFHCWPFAREFVQNATQRMGLTVPPIPMFRVLQKRLESGATAKAQSVAGAPTHKRTRRRTTVEA